MTDLVVHGLSKSFSGVNVLRSVDLTAKSGQIHGLVGENGAGKSTLMNIIGGNLQADSGKMTLDGSLYQPASAGDAQRCGVGLVHQELNLFSNLSIAENLFLNRFPRTGPCISRSVLLQQATGLLQRVGLDLKPTVSVSRLSIGERQLVEIARALSFDSKVLLLDEPTTSLSDQKCDRFFQLIHQLASEGRAIILITHAIEDVLRECDQVSVLRDGVVAKTGPVSDMNSQQVIQSMVGRPVSQFFPKRIKGNVNPIESPVLLDVRHLSQPNTLDNISFVVREGEVLGVFGLMGAGRTELARALFGLDPYQRGTLTLKGRPLTGSPAQRIRNGVSMLTESRRRDGICADASVAENISLVALRRFCKGWFGGVDERRLKSEIASMRESVCLQPSLRNSQPMRTLSGGNQQKAILGKWLMSNPCLLILDEPTRGIDVAAKHEIYQLIHELADKGTGVLAISSDLEELIGICDRLIVMSLGRITADLSCNQFDRGRILQAALSQHHRQEQLETQEAK